MINNNNYTLQDIMNKLFCTFTSEEGLEDTLNTIKSHYSILYNKIFILEANEGVVDPNYKIEWNDFKNTILLTQGSDLRKLQTKINRIISA